MKTFLKILLSIIGVPLAIVAGALLIPAAIVAAVGLSLLMPISLILELIWE